ncbi:MAG: 2Fe-2S iron-sulfur cluster binding domain-containing protein [Candidatus Thiodiazotropha sp.]
MKTAILIHSDPKAGDEALGRLFNWLAVAHDAKPQGGETRSLFLGAGTRFGWPGSQLHFERFGVEARVDDKPLTVTLARSNRSIAVPAHLSILDVLLLAGIDLPHDCKRGECSLCRTRVLEGQPDHRDLSLDADERKESMCVCVSRAHSDHLTLDR